MRASCQEDGEKGTGVGRAAVLLAGSLALAPDCRDG